MTTDTLPTAATLITDDTAAINFVLDHLEPFEASGFLSDRREGKGLEPWLAGVRHDRMMAAE
ncbi:hypothetical protein ACFSQQ_26195 [Mesorhizobium kowhaii]|uniref:hypothetical protein n=1 Tax=Mesorhizobium kowhaii TaxID=1300272 RepID=UPI0035EBBEED